MLAEDAAGGRFQRPAAAGASVSDPAMEREITRRDDTKKDPPLEVLRAYSPYLIIIAVFSIAQIPAIKDALAESPWTTTFQWPGLDVRNADGEAPEQPSRTTFNWLPAAGTLLLISGPAHDGRAAGSPPAARCGCSGRRSTSSSGRSSPSRRCSRWPT